MDPATFLGDATMRLRPSQTMRAARLLITDVYVWTQHARARDASGRNCKPNDPRACSWSMNGAIAVVSNPHGVTPPFLLRRLDFMVMELGKVNRLFPQQGEPHHATCAEVWESSDDFNDFRTHADVLNLMDAAYVWLYERGQ
jgi:hypothetical protein